MQFTRHALRCRLTSAEGFRPGKRQDLHKVDYQTLFTHNHTIISFSLIEGLTYNHRAYHAVVRCHKKYDCSMRAQTESYSMKALDLFSLSLQLIELLLSV